jgi:tRNA threonylcarbamoyladenosine biosynthesis protein TsaE
MPGTLELATTSAQETRALGEAVAALLAPGDVVSLTGDLGAGKTTLIQGLAGGLGVREPVLSPTFTLVREYEGHLRVYHLDVYRLDRIQDVLDLGFEEMLDDGGVVLIEWGDAIEALMPEAYLQIELTLAAGVSGMPDLDPGFEPEPARQIWTTAQGVSWARRWEEFEARVAPWTVQAEEG